MILLIGATGFLGPPVLSGLLGSGHRVCCLVRQGSNGGDLAVTAGAAGKDITLAGGDLDDPDSMTVYLRQADSAVYMVDLAETGPLRNFLAAAEKFGPERTVFIGSTTVHIPLNSLQKRRKLESEALIGQSGLKYTILRPTMIYGSPHDPNFSRMIRFVARWGFFVTFGSGENLIQPVYIGDVARAVAGVMEDKKTYGQAYDLPGKSPLRYNEMLDIVKKAIGRDFRVIRLHSGLSKTLLMPYALLSRNPSLSPGQIDRMGIDKSYDYKKAGEDFGYSPLSFRQGIRRLVRDMGIKARG